MVRLRQMVAFVGGGRTATQAGNQRPRDAVAVAGILGLDRVPSAVRSLDEFPGVARVFHWAVAAGFLAVRGTKIVLGPRADAL